MWKLVFPVALTPSGFVSDTTEDNKYRRGRMHKMDNFWNHMTMRFVIPVVFYEA